MKKAIIFLQLLWLLSIFFRIHADINDNFSDRDITLSPPWYGDTSYYQTDDSCRLWLSAFYESDKAYLVTKSNAIQDAVWQFTLWMEFNPSSSNYTRVYLVSDKDSLEKSLNGYFVEVGGSSDEISLYRQEGYKETEIIDGKNDRVDTSDVNVTVKVTRDSSGNWSLFADTTGGSDFYIEGSAFDNKVYQCKYFGIVCAYTKTRSDRFRFDDISVTGRPFVDTTAPKMQNYNVISDTSIQIIFNEKIDKEEITLQKSFVLNDSLLPQQIDMGEQDTSIVLYFKENFSDGSNVLTIDSLSDIFNNYAIGLSIEFEYYTAKPFDVVINEVMADPEPVVNLPSYEYLELYNQASYDIDLTGWSLSIGSTKKYFSEDTICSEGFIIVCHEDAVSSFSPYGPVAGIFTSQSTLSNAGEEVILYDDKGTRIDFVHYSPDWYETTYKEDGGWSLEMIDINNPCGGEGNWKETDSPDGGTPGSENNVKDINPDNITPELYHISMQGDSALSLFFNEPLDHCSALSRMLYEVDHGTGHPDSVILNAPYYNRATLYYNQPFEQNTTYYLTVQPGISDCAGNQTTTTLSEKFAIPSSIDSLDIVINEVLFNPVGDGADFVELYNRSANVIDLSGVRLATRDEMYNLASLCNISPNGYLLFPGEYVVLTTDQSNINDEYKVCDINQMIEIDDMPSFNNDEGRVVIARPSGQVIDEFYYNEEMHFDLLDDVDGVSLERIHYDRSTNDETNWHSAAQDAGYATPTCCNSQFDDMMTANREIFIENEVFSPDNDGYHDVLTINYSFDKGGYVANVTVFDIKGRAIRHLLQNEMLGKEGAFSWNGNTDSGGKAAIGMYVVYISLFNMDGVTKEFKKVCVLAGHIN